MKTWKVLNWSSFYSLENEPSLSQIQRQAKRFMAVYLDDNKPDEAEKIVSKAEEIADKIRTDSEKAICKIYIQIMKKVISKGLLV